MVISCPLTIDTFWISRSPVPSVIDVTVPCICVVVTDESLMRKCPAVPVADAVPDHVPSFVFDPPDAAFIKSLGKTRVESSDPVSSSAHDAGCSPVKRSTRGDGPMVVSMESRRPLRTATDS